MLDIHSHILHNVDDGSKSLDESTEIISELSMLGFSAFVLTPHIYSIDDKNQLNLILSKFHELRDVFSERKDKMEFTLGTEILLSMELLQTDPFEPITFVVSQRRYQLIELHPLLHPIALDSYTSYAKKHEITPILAHIERMRKIVKDKGLRKNLKDKGFLFQVDLTSFSRMADPLLKENAKMLINENSIDLLGTDCHSIKDISSIAEGLDFIKIKTDACEKYFKIE